MPDSDKTQKATPHRRKKAREQGQIARSREFGNVLALVGSAITLAVMCSDLVPHWAALYEGLLIAACDGDIGPAGPIWYCSTIEVLRWVDDRIGGAPDRIGLDRDAACRRRPLDAGGRVHIDVDIAAGKERRSAADGAGRSFQRDIPSERRAYSSRFDPHVAQRGIKSHTSESSGFSDFHRSANQSCFGTVARRRADRRPVGEIFATFRREHRRNASGRNDRRIADACGARRVHGKGN